MGKNITGFLVIMSCSGTSASKGPKDKRWYVSTDYIAYDDGNGFIQEDGTIYMYAVESEINSIREQLTETTVVKLSGTKKDKLIELNEILETNITTNKEANEIIEKYLEPFIYVDEIAGEFVLDKAINTFTGTFDINGNDINVYFSDAENDIKELHFLYNNLDELVIKASEYAADKLTILANEWAKDRDDYNSNVKEITKSDFVKRMELSEISIWSGTYSLWFDDGGLFWDHSIRVTGNLKNGFTEAEIEG